MKNIKGFTLVELLMVMGLLAVVAGFFIATYPASQRRARDTQRKNDLKQYQTALETQANKNAGIYPSRTSATQADSDTFCVTDLKFSSGDCPPDPKTGQSGACNDNDCDYYYISDGSDAGVVDGTDYVLWGSLEQPASSDYWVVCSTGVTGESASEPTDESCPI